MNSNISNINTELVNTNEVILAYPKHITPYMPDLSVPDLDTKVNNTNFRLCAIDHTNDYLEENILSYRFAVSLNDYSFRLYYDSGFKTFNYKPNRPDTQSRITQYCAQFIQCLQDIYYTLSNLQNTLQKTSWPHIETTDNTIKYKLPFTNNHYIVFETLHICLDDKLTAIESAKHQCTEHIEKFYNYVFCTLNISRNDIMPHLIDPKAHVTNTYKSTMKNANNFYWY